MIQWIVISLLGISQIIQFFWLREHNKHLNYHDNHLASINRTLKVLIPDDE